MEPPQRLDEVATEEARALLFRCCGSTRWVGLMMAGRPYGSTRALLAAARSTWRALSADDWKEAFSDHPRIGDRAALGPRFATSRDLSAREQAGVASAPPETIDALAAGNLEYESKFGYVFLVCATGKTADEMLTLLRTRLPNDPSVEIRIAAEEQEKIMALRLQGLSGEGS